MASAWFRFYEELNDFLPSHRRKVAFQHRFRERGSIKDMIESLGVPHPEVDLILVNGESVSFRYLVRDGDRISVYPMFESLDIGPLVRVRPAPLRVTRFVLDVHLGRLARYLRMLGFDTLYRNDCDDAELAELASGQHRILLTRDLGLLKRSIVTHGLFVRATCPQEQVREVVARLQLQSAIQPFRRCVSCNGLLVAVSRGAVAHRLEPGVRGHFRQFWRCAGCRQIYWQGSHYQRMEAWVRELLGARLKPDGQRTSID